MSVRSAQSITVEFVTSRFDTGAAANADSTPAGTLIVNGTDNAASVTVTNVDTGRYKAAVTLPTLSVGDVVELSVAATVNSVAGKGIVWRDTKDVVIDSAGLVDANAVKVGPTGSGTAQTARDIGASVLLSSGSGTGQLSFTSGILKVDVDTIKTQSVTNAAGVTFSPFVGSTGAAVNGTNANTLSGHDPGATLGTSTLTQTQVTGGAYALNSSSFGFNAALDFTTTQKAATLARVTLVDTTTTNTDMIAAAGIRTAVGLASANLDTQLGLIYGVIDTEVATANTNISALITTVGVAGAGLSAIPKTGFKLASDGADSVLVDGKTLPAALQIIAAAAIGKVSGAGTGTEVFVGLDGTTTRATVTVDSSGNRSGVVYV